jgi:hypothetical protein
VDREFLGQTDRSRGASERVEAFCKKLEADGVKVDAPFRDVPRIGLKIAFVIDPAGTRVELTQGLAGR